MKYTHYCETCGVVEIECAMKDATSIMPCPVCSKDSKRVYSAVNDVWRTVGAYSKKDHTT